LFFENLNSIHGRSEINGKGSLTFGDSPRMDLVFEKPRATYEDSLEIYETLTKNMEFLPADLNLDYSASFKVKGPMDLKKLVIDGQLKAGNNSIYFENINAFESKFQFKNNKVKLYDFKVLKGKGIITGEFNYNLYNNNLNYNGKISGVLLSDIEVLSNANLGFDGSLEGEFEGERKSDFFKSSNLLNIKNGIIDEEKIEDSTITITSEGKKVFSTGNFFGQKISFNSFFNFNKKEPKNLSYFNIHINLAIKPTIKILPKATSKVITRGMTDIFKGMFDLVD